MYKYDRKGPKRGVALYSYSAEFGLTKTLEDCFEDVHDMGAHGIEILANTHIENYPYPTDEWVEKWWRLCDKYEIVPGRIRQLDRFPCTRRQGPYDRGVRRDAQERHPSGAPPRLHGHEDQDAGHQRSARAGPELERDHRRARFRWQRNSGSGCARRSTRRPT